jgi:hypothetical protein
MDLSARCSPEQFVITKIEAMISQFERVTMHGKSFLKPIFIKFSVVISSTIIKFVKNLEKTDTKLAKSPQKVADDNKSIKKKSIVRGVYKVAVVFHHRLGTPERCTLPKAKCLRIIIRLITLYSLITHRETRLYAGGM